MSKSIYYITGKKLKELKKEHEKLILMERSKFLGQETPKMLESEDLNPEFVSFQEDVILLRSRIEEIKHILENHHLIKKPSKEKRNLVGLGCKVVVEVGGKKDEFTILGTLEANPSLGKISNESPVGKALLGRKVGEEITISSPIKTTYKIRTVKYEIS